MNSSELASDAEKEKQSPLKLGLQEASDSLVIDDSENGFVTVLDATPTAKTDTDMVVQGTLNVRNDGDAPAEVTYRCMLDGETSYSLAYTVTIPPGAWSLSPVQIQCDAFDAGKHTVELQAQVLQAKGGSVRFGSRSMFLVQFGPIFSPPG